MKKLALSMAVAGVILTGCGENLPKEITSHENFKYCKELEKNLLTIQNTFAVDERVKFYEVCTRRSEKSVDKDAIKDLEKFKNQMEANFVKSIAHLYKGYLELLNSKQFMENRDTTKYFTK